MNRSEARKIAEIITNDQLRQMFENAKKGIKDWTKTSTVNKSMTKGTAWNILGKNFDVNQSHHIMAKQNMIREFGEWLPVDLKPVSNKTNTFNENPPVHQEPDFDDWFFI